MIFGGGVWEASNGLSFVNTNENPPQTAEITVFYLRKTGVQEASKRPVWPISAAEDLAFCNQGGKVETGTNRSTPGSCAMRSEVV